ncbi:MAG TPA: glycosyltransferase N-terminal domain-containing protein [Chitinophagaceae bacterium]|nr:glycosyltransferase N-terminal domain-containing protein [Chitinophagaceae bacterium]
MGKLLYLLFITLYPIAARMLSLFNKKAALWVKGRRHVIDHIVFKCQRDPIQRIWVHCSSLGEFEQGRPLIEAVKTAYPQYKILLTFFSPSGYEVQKDYKGADYIYYLPMDSFLTANRFYNAVQPRLVIFIKYEFWYYYLHEAARRNIPLLLVSGMFREKQLFFKWYGGFYRSMLHCFSHLFVQTQKAASLLQGIGINNNSITGDTRFDRVLHVAATHVKYEYIEAFCGDKTTIVAGSTWTEDDEELDHYANTHTGLRFIIAPHDISEERLHECETLYKHSARYSKYTQKMEAGESVDTSVNTLIIDNIGMLKYLYGYATICYVGGGFGGDGVHNVAEAAVYYKPVVFGPVFEKFAEAVSLVEAGGAFAVTDALMLEKQMDLLINDTELYRNAATEAGDYIKNNAGATSQVMEYIQEKRLLTN